MRRKSDARHARGGASCRFINRDLSWAAFNRRVMDEALNPGHPLLERVRFLSIAANNLDEFYMVHVVGLRRQVEAGMTFRQIDGLTPAETLERLTAAIALMQQDLRQRWGELDAMLRRQGLAILKAEELSAEDWQSLGTVFAHEIFPLLTPIAINREHPFPFLPNRGLAVIANLSGPGGRIEGLVRVPQQASRFVRLPGPAFRALPIEMLIARHLPALFAGCAVEGSGTLRVIRDSDLSIEDLEMEDDAEHLLLSFETALQRSRHGDVVQLAVGAGMPNDLLELLQRSLAGSPGSLQIQPGILGLANLSELLRDDRPDLKFAPYIARYPGRVRRFEGDCFAAVRAGELLVHHPYETFDIVVQFIRQAAADPDVVAIKQTLYRTSENSPIVQALVEAAQSGKSVTAVVELKARFDEEANLRWARDLEKAGAQVTYGFIDLKVHAKLSLVIRREGDGLASYIHYGTGNYHPLTARVYTDLSLFSYNTALCGDAARLFNYMTGSAAPQAFDRIAAAPLTLRTTLLDLIHAESALARDGQPGTIWFKLNALSDPQIIEALYEAAAVGVKIRGIVRGICTLRAGVPGLSETIRIHSIIGRFLEHARIVCFGNGRPLPSSHAKLFISSADWMPRNLDHRIETLVPIDTATIRRQIMEQIMIANLNDDTEAWELLADDTWRRVVAAGEPFSAQDYFRVHPDLPGRSDAPDEGLLSLELRAP